MSDSQVGGFTVKQEENRRVLYLGAIRYCSMSEQDYAEWAKGWLEKRGEFYAMREVEPKELEADVDLGD